MINLRKYKLLYLMMIPGIMYFVIFCYGPMFGIIIAFQRYNPSQGLRGMFSEAKWVGFDHFKRLFSSYYFTRILRNTITIFSMNFLTCFPLTIIMALLINELHLIKFKRVVQTLSYMPHFFSWVVVTSITILILNPTSGLVAGVVKYFGGEPVNYLTSTTYFRWILVVQNLWKGLGWGTIIYLAAFAGIDPELYEYAKVEGAGRVAQMWYITIPSISFMISINIIMSVGSVLNAGFEEILLLYNPAVYEVADVIDTFVYREGIVNTNFSYSTAVGLFKNVVGIILTFGANMACKKLGYEGIW